MKRELTSGIDSGRSSTLAGTTGMASTLAFESCVGQVGGVIGSPAFQSRKVMPTTDIKYLSQSVPPRLVRVACFGLDTVVDKERSVLCKANQELENEVGGKRNNVRRYRS